MVQLRASDALLLRSLQETVARARREGMLGEAFPYNTWTQSAPAMKSQCYACLLLFENRPDQLPQRAAVSRAGAFVGVLLDIRAYWWAHSCTARSKAVSPLATSRKVHVRFRPRQGP